MSETLRSPYQPCEAHVRTASPSISRESIGPLRSSSLRTKRLKRAFVSRNSAARRSCAYFPRRRRRIRARRSGSTSIGQMYAFHSMSFFSSHSSRSSSVLSYGPSRLQRTSCCGGATVEIGSIWRKPSRRTVSRTPVAEPSRSCARMAIRRASSGETIVIARRVSSPIVRRSRSSARSKASSRARRAPDAALEVERLHDERSLASART